MAHVVNVSICDAFQYKDILSEYFTLLERTTINPLKFLYKGNMWSILDLKDHSNSLCSPPRV